MQQTMIFKVCGPGDRRQLSAHPPAQLWGVLGLCPLRGQDPGGEAPFGTSYQAAGVAGASLPPFSQGNVGQASQSSSWLADWLAQARATHHATVVKGLVTLRQAAPHPHPHPGELQTACKMMNGWKCILSFFYSKNCAYCNLAGVSRGKTSVPSLCLAVQDGSPHAADRHQNQSL